MFLTEMELKEKFWENYNYSGRAIRYQFESSIREGNADLVTVEMFQNNVQFNSFEFKLSDIKKAIVQAEHNSKYVHKSWICLLYTSCSLCCYFMRYIASASGKRL